MNFSKNTPTQVAVCQIRLKSVSLIKAALYLDGKLGIHADNLYRIKNLTMLSEILNLPLLITADTNIDLPDLEASGWLESLGLTAVCVPGIKTTTNKASQRETDYILCSKSIEYLILEHFQLKDVNWSPHFGQAAKLAADPSKVKGWRMLLPQELPIEEALVNLKEFSEADQQLSYSQSINEAKRVLNIQKQRTGTAILGKPPEALMHDLKCQGETLAASIQVGEKYALTSLAIELFILKHSKVPAKHRPRYIGRCQYPRFAYGPVLDTQAGTEDGESFSYSFNQCSTYSNASSPTYHLTNQKKQ